MSLPPPSPARAPLRVIYTQMVADLFHYGHVEFLKAARALGDRLVVQVLDDAYVASIKRPAILDQRERMAVVASCRYVDEVNGTWPPGISLDFMRAQGLSVYAIGFATPAEETFKRRGCRALPAEMVVALPYTPGISSTSIRQRVLAAGA